MASSFLSHSSKDKTFARRLAKDLQRKGISVWFDEAEMLPGDSLIGKLERAIKSAAYLGVLLSPNSVESKWVRKEVEIAAVEEIKERRLKVIPIMYSECVVPGFLSGKVWAELSFRIVLGW